MSSAEAAPGAATPNPIYNNRAGAEAGKGSTAGVCEGGSTSDG